MTYVIQKHIVAQCFERLRTQRTHPLFAGYLHLQQRASELARLDDLQPDFLGFYKLFFLVADHPLGTPYIKPFTEQKPSKQNLWLNENVAGSYAPSSLRLDQPFRRVVHIEKKEYTLRPEHPALALEHLLYDHPIRVADLAIFLYRDFGLVSADHTVPELVDVFAYEFGYADIPGGARHNQFETLFSLEGMNDWPSDWMEPL